MQTSLNEEDIQQKKWEAQGIHLELHSDYGEGTHSVSCESSPSADEESKEGQDCMGQTSPLKDRKKLNTADRK